MKSDKYNQKGQALILLLLVMAAVLTVVLSAVSRSVTEVTVSSFEEDSLRAFSAAEAGIEDKLLNPQVGNFAPVNLDSSTSYDADVTINRETDRQFKYPKELSSGESATFWLVSHEPTTGRLNCTGPGQLCYRGNQISMCWGKEPVAESPNNPAIEVGIFYDDAGPPPNYTQSVLNPNNFSNVKVARTAFDDQASSKGNHFNSSSVSTTEPCVIDGQEFVYKVSNVIPSGFDPLCQAVNGCFLMAVVRMLDNDTPQPIGIIVSGGPNDLPAQGILIESKGSAGQSTRKVNVFQSYPEIPNLFDAAVFSLNGLTK
jgi:hypothetical protein